MSCQTFHSRLEIVFLRSAFLETTDQTSQSDYRPIVIGRRSNRAPLHGTVENRVYFLLMMTLKDKSLKPEPSEHEVLGY